jgi:hypothetical protein
MTVGVQMVLANGIAGMSFGGCRSIFEPSFDITLSLDSQPTWVVSSGILSLTC